MNQSAIIYFMKLPKKGYSKTRLQNFLPADNILHLCTYLIQQNYQVIQDYPADVYLFVTPQEDLAQVHDYLDIDLSRVFPQLMSDHLGQRMAQAMEQVFQLGYQKVALMGCDLIDLDRPILNQAFEGLDHCDLVLAPARDGGYGLIATKAFHPELFNLTHYSHDQVLRQTLDQAQSAGLTWTLTRTILDIDDRDDVAAYLTGDSAATFLNQGEYNANFIFDQGKKLLRVALGSQMHLKHQIVYEYQALKALEPSGVVPKVYDCQAETDLMGLGFLTEEFLPGRPLNYQTDLNKAAELLARVHHVDPKRGRDLIRADQPFELMYQEFQSMFKHYQDWPQKKSQVESVILSLLDSLSIYDRQLPLEDPCIINTELNSHNFLINESGPSYIIDWEKPLISEREQDLAHFLAPTTTLWRTDQLIEGKDLAGFVTAYNKYSTVPVKKDRLKQYLHFTCLRGVTWCAMAYVQYLNQTKVKAANSSAFATIERFISLPFLENIQTYINDLERLLQ